MKNVLCCDPTLARSSPRRFAVAVCTATAVLLLLTGPGAATPAAASGLSIGAGSTVQLDSAVLALGCNDLLIESAGTLQAQASTIRLAGNWTNHGTFEAGTGTVLLEDGCGAGAIANVSGNNTFFDLRINTSIGKTVRFEAGATQDVLDGLTLMGAPGNLLVVRSSIPGQQAVLNLAPGASQLIDYVDVADNRATGQRLSPGPAAAAHSIDSGNTFGWFFSGGAIPTLSGVGGAALFLLLFAALVRRTSRKSGTHPLGVA